MTKTAKDYPGRPTRTEDQCQHPKYRSGGVCERASIGVFDIPDDYIPPKRHAKTPEIPRPKARLCLQHSARVSSHKTGETGSAGTHQAQCRVCQHPERKRLEGLWTSWVWSTGEIIRELGITQSSWYKHVEQFDLWKKKSVRGNTTRALIQAAERGLESGGHNVKTGLEALRLLAKERGDAAVLDVRVNAADLANMSDDELAKTAKSLIAQLEQEQEGDDDSVN